MSLTVAIRCYCSSAQWESRASDHQERWLTERSPRHPRRKILETTQAFGFSCSPDRSNTLDVSFLRENRSIQRNQIETELNGHVKLGRSRRSTWLRESAVGRERIAETSPTAVRGEKRNDVGVVWRDCFFWSHLNPIKLNSILLLLSHSLFPLNSYDFCCHWKHCSLLVALEW